MNDRRRLDQDEGLRLQNTPLRPRQRRDLLERPDVVYLESDDGEVFIAPDQGQRKMHWAFRDIDTMRHEFPDMWKQALKELNREEVDYISMDLSGLPTREWLEPMLRDADFDFFALPKAFSQLFQKAGVVPVRTIGPPIALFPVKIRLCVMFDQPAGGEPASVALSRPARGIVKRERETGVGSQGSINEGK